MMHFYLYIMMHLCLPPDSKPNVSDVFSSKISLATYGHQEDNYL